MKCIEMVALMPYRALDCLEADEKESLERHLEKCERCAEESRKRDGLMATLAEPLPGEPALEPLWAKVKAAVALEKPASPEASAAAVPAVEVTIALVCSFCHDVLARNEACYCASCLAPHHDDCFKAHGRCSAYGCDETATVRPRRDEPVPPKRAPAPRRRRGALLAIPLALLAGGGAVAALVQRGPRLVTLHANEEPLGAVVARIAEQARTPIFVDDDVKEKISLDALKLPWREALDRAVKAGKSVVRPLGDGALVVEQPPRVTIQFTDANVRTVIQLLASYAGKNVIISPEVHGDVTLDVHEAIWDDTLRTVVASVGDYVVQTKGDILKVLPRAARSTWGSEDLSWPKWPDPLEPGAPEPRHLDLDVENGDIREVCARLAEAAGRSIDVAPTVSARVTIHAKDTSWRALLGYASREGTFAIRERDGMLHVEDVPKITLQFTDANVRTVCQLLAAEAGANVVIAPEVVGDVTLDVHEVFFDELLDAVVTTMGDYEVLREGENLFRVVARSSVTPVQAYAPKGHVSHARPVNFPGGRTVEIALEGLLAGPQGTEATRAIISGRVYEKGDALRDDNGKTLNVQLVRIGDREIELEDTDDPSRPRVTVKVGGGK